MLVLHAGFVLTGVVSNLLGALLPLLSLRLSLSDTQAGYLFTAQFSGMLTGNMASGRMIARLGLRRTLVAGYVFMAAGVAALGLDGWVAAAASICLYGSGLGLTIPPTNLSVAESNPEKSAAALNVLNLAWGLGAVTCPSVVAIFAQRNELLLPQLMLLSALAAIALLLSQLADGAFAGQSKPAHQPGGDVATIWRSPTAILIGSLIFLYVGTENAIGGWVATYTQRATSAPVAAWAMAQSLFWATLLAGRGIAPLILRRLAGDKLVVASLAIAGCGAALLLGGMGLTGHWSGIALAGAGMAAVFPTTIAVYSQVFGARAARSVGLLFAIGGLGGASLPWLVGLVSSRAGSLRTGMFVPLLAILAMIALQALLIRFLSRRDQREPGESR